MTDTLVAALHAFQAQAPTLQKDKINPAFRSKYLSLDGLMEQVLPALNAQGLVWVTMPGAGQDGEPALDYRLIHVSSGEEITGVMPLMLAKRDPQGQGSALTYARRYSLMAVLGLVADEDDDGNHASQGSAPASDAVSEGQRRLIWAKAKEAKLTASQLVNVLRLSAGKEPLSFDSEDGAGAWLDENLPKLPKRLVNTVVENLAKEQS